MKKLLIIFPSVFIFLQSCTIKENAPVNLSGRKQVLKEWKLRSSLLVNEKESTISSTDYSDSVWIKAEVPTTVLRALVKAGIYPDPHFDLNDLQIPDASDTLNKRLNLGKYSYIKNITNPFKYPYWFRTTFTVPKENRGKKIGLNFDGINYRADVWLNGKQVADSGKMAGMFQRFKYDITPFANPDGENVLAVKIYQVDHVGTANPGVQFEVFGPNRGQGKDIFKDVTLKLSAGWDCAPVVRDRNMGIYQEVYLTYTRDVNISNTCIVTDLPLPDTTRAAITVSTVLTNTGSTSLKGILKGRIDMLKEIDFHTYKKKMPGTMKPVVFEKEVEIGAGQTVNVTFSPGEFSRLNIKDPHLWWPNGYGMQYLHNLHLEFDINGKASDIQNTTFGIRKITSTVKEIDGNYGRVIMVNGRRIFCRGGWIQPDMMLDMNPKRAYDEARLMAEAGINMIASEDMPSPPDHVMETYDKYGLMVWETFYQCWRTYPGTPLFVNPLDAKLALKNSFDIVRRYRNNPSLVIWCVANESLPREEIYVPLREYIRKMDPTRVFIATSNYGWDVDSLTPYMKPDLPTGVTDEGLPDYTWYPHSYYYNMVLQVKDQMFKDELGVPAIPNS